MLFHLIAIVFLIKITKNSNDVPFKSLMPFVGELLCYTIVRKCTSIVNLKTSIPLKGFSRLMGDSKNRKTI
jgi:hypothetical protein